jgi:hypothetical protein
MPFSRQKTPLFIVNFGPRASETVEIALFRSFWALFAADSTFSGPKSLNFALKSLKNGEKRHKTAVFYALGAVFSISEHFESISMFQSEDCAFLAKKMAEMTENWPKMTENGTEMAENGTEMAENGSEMAENGSEMAENGTEMAENCEILAFLAKILLNLAADSQFFAEISAEKAVKTVVSGLKISNSQVPIFFFFSFFSFFYIKI